MEKTFQLVIEYSYDDEFENPELLADEIVENATTVICCDGTHNSLCTRDWFVTGQRKD